MMKTITIANRSRLLVQLPTLLLGFIAMWNFRKHGYPTLAIIKVSIYGYIRMRKGYEGKNKDKRINQMMFFAKNELLRT